MRNWYRAQHQKSWTLLFKLEEGFGIAFDPSLVWGFRPSISEVSSVWMNWSHVQFFLVSAGLGFADVIIRPAFKARSKRKSWISWRFEAEWERAVRTFCLILILSAATGSFHTSFGNTVSYCILLMTYNHVSVPRRTDVRAYLAIIWCLHLSPWVCFTMCIYLGWVGRYKSYRPGCGHTHWQ